MISYIVILFVFIGFTAIVFAENPPFLEKYDFVTDDIVKIDDEIFFISLPHIIVDDPNTMTTFHGINFTIPYNPNPPVPGGIRSSVITFPNGGTEKLSKGVTDVETSFAKSFGLKAGISRSGNFFFFLVSINSESPLKQIKSGIAINEIQCKESLILVTKHDGSPACVKPETIQKLIERNWTTQLIVQDIVFKTMSKHLAPVCAESTMDDITRGMVSGECSKFITELTTKRQSEMMQRGYFFDQERQSWIKDGYPDVMMSIAEYYQQNLNISESELDVYSKPELNPVTKSIITVQDRPVNRTIVPITITEKTTNAESLDTITQWNFSILGIEMSTLNNYWGNLADQYITTEFVDQNGNDVLDYSRIPDGRIFYKLSLWYYPASCEGGQKVTGEGGYPEPIPIKKGASDVFFKSGDIGLYPDDDGKYFFDFVSGFETEIEFHPNVKVISQETKKCNLEIERGNFTDVYYTNAVFNFED